MIPFVKESVFDGAGVGRKLAEMVGDLEAPTVVPRLEMEVAAADGSNGLDWAGTEHLEVGVELRGHYPQRFPAIRIREHFHG